MTIRSCLCYQLQNLTIRTVNYTGTTDIQILPVKASSGWAQMSANAVSEVLNTSTTVLVSNNGKSPWLHIRLDVMSSNIIHATI